MKIIEDIGQIPRTVPLYIYGAGGAGRALFAHLEHRPGFSVVGLIDSRATGTVAGRPILSPERFAAARPDDAVVLIASQYHAEIAAALKRLGFLRYFNAFPLAELVLMEAATARIGFDDVREATEFYDERFAKGYLDDWDEDRKSMLRSLFAMVQPAAGTRILDFGCGTGVLTALIAELFPDAEVWGADISRTAVGKASAQYPGLRFQTFDQLGGPETEPPAGGFDLIFSHHVLEHVYDLESTVREMATLLKPDGVMLHLLPCGNPGSLEHRICTWYRDGIDPERAGRFFYEDQGHLRRLTPDALERLFALYDCRLERSLFTNQFWGAVKWISESPPVFIRHLCNGGADGALHPRRLRMLRRGFLALHRVRRLESDGASPVSRRLGAIADALVRGFARREWRRHAKRPNGSEMVLFFSRRAG